MITQSSTVFKVNMKGYIFIIRQLIYISSKLMSIVFSHLPRLSKLSWSLWGETVKSHCTTKQRYICCALFLCGRQIRKEQNESSNFNQLEKSLWWWQVSVMVLHFSTKLLLMHLVYLLQSCCPCYGVFWENVTLWYPGCQTCMLTIFIIKS